MYNKLTIKHCESFFFICSAYLMKKEKKRLSSRGTKVEKMLTLAPERYTAGFCIVAKVILWCI